MADSTSFKRVLTDDIYSASQASNGALSASGTPDDIALQLRNVGSRARKSVLEGYRTSPPSLTNIQSSGSTFRAMNDILRDVYADISAPTSKSPSHSGKSRKRARSVTDLDQADSLATAENTKMSVDPCSEPIAASPRAGLPLTSSRPIKSLRSSSRAFLETRSLPSGPFSFSAVSHGSQGPSATPTAEEADWSGDAFARPSTHDFEPMVLE